MREIKFRCWNREKNFMLKSGIDSICVGGNDIVYIEYQPTTAGYEAKTPYHFTNPEVENVEVMQYVGIKDKNQKEIYEKDIVRTIDRDGNENIFVVEWEILSSNTGFPIGFEDEDIEVIGNVFENPELVK